MKFRCISVLLFVSIFNTTSAQENAEYEKAYAAYESGAIDESFIFLKNSIDANPNHLPTKLLMAEVLALSGYYVDSLSEFEESIALGADLNLVIQSYVRVLMIVEDFGRILDLPETSLTASNTGLLRSAKGAAYANREEHIQASEYFGMAYEVAPKNVNVLNSAARYYLSVNNNQLAKTRLDESLSVDRSNSNTFELLARYFKAENRIDESINALRNGLVITDTHPVLLRELVSAYAQKGDFAAAKTVVNKTLETSPTDPMARLLLSWLSAQVGESELSKSTLNDLVNQLSLVKTNDLAQQDYALFVSAVANYASNNLEIARGQLEQYVNRNPRNFEATKLLTDIFERELAFTAAANALERFPTEVDADVKLVAKLCRIYVRARQNHKCNTLLNRNRPVHGQTETFVQAEANLLAARGKLDLAVQNLNAIESTDISVLAQRAVFAIQDGQLELAETAIAQLLSIAPDNNDFLNLNASVLKKQSKFGEAEVVYQKILEQDPSHYAAGFNLTHIYYLTNRLRKAKANALSLLEVKPNDVDLLLLYANILTAREEFTRALEAITDAESFSSNNDKVDEAFIKLFVASKDLDRALFRVNKLISKDPSNVRLIRQRAGLLYELGRESDAQKDLRVLFGLLSNDSQSLFALADIQGQYSDLDGALQTLLQADSVNPGNLFINRNIAKLALIQQNRTLAADKVDWLKVVAPNNADILLLQADLAMFDGKEQEAARHYLNAIRLNNSLSPALIGAYQLAQKGIREEEFVTTFAYLARDPDNNIFSTHLLADFYYSRKNMVDAKNAYISISGQYGYGPLPMVFNNLANIYVYENKLDAAYNFAQQAYELVTKEPAILSTLGWIIVLQGDHDLGLSLLRQAYAMNVQDPDVQYHIAFALYKLQRNAESRKMLTDLLNNFPDFDKRLDAIALKKLIK